MVIRRVTTAKWSPGDGPRRASLSQDRSRQTRRRLVRAAVGLWTERGFEQGYDKTTVEEIARAAGVTKGTFYFHFARKSDILKELGWGTAEAIFDEAVSGVAAGQPAMSLLQQLLVSLAGRVESVPRPAVLRAVAEFRGDHSPGDVPGRRDLHQGIAVALDAARAQGQLPEATDTDELARVVAALTMDALLRWAQGDGRDLRSVLRTRAETVLAGAAAGAG